MTPQYYTMDELRAFGCPDGLLIQYVFCTKEEIDRIIAHSKRKAT